MYIYIYICIYTYIYIYIYMMKIMLKLQGNMHKTNSLGIGEYFSAQCGMAEYSLG